MSFENNSSHFEYSESHGNASEQLSSILRFFREYETFAVVSHEEPDGDCVGSSLALASFLRRLKPEKEKSVFLYSPGPFKRFEIKQFEDRFRCSVDKQWERTEAVVVLDCSTPERIGFFQDAIADRPVAVIDHHSAGEEFGTVKYIDSSAPSVSYLIQLICEQAGYAPTQEEADSILFGLCTDTGFFRHLTENSWEVFEAVSRLTAAGASPNEIYGLINGDRPLPSRRLLGTLLARTEAFFGGRLLFTYETFSDLPSSDTGFRDSDTLYSLLQTVSSAEIVVLLREEKDGAKSVGLRSNGDIDVGKIARSFGGGGHKKAAGFPWNGTHSALKKQILDRFSDRFK